MISSYFIKFHVLVQGGIKVTYKEDKRSQVEIQSQVKKDLKDRVKKSNQPYEYDVDEKLTLDFLTEAPKISKALKTWGRFERISWGVFFASTGASLNGMWYLISKEVFVMQSPISWGSVGKIGAVATAVLLALISLDFACLAHKKINGFENQCKETANKVAEGRATLINGTTQTPEQKPLRLSSQCEVPILDLLTKNEKQKLINA